jgi:hypothetical protein
MMATTSRLVDEITGESIQLLYDESDPNFCQGPIFQSSIDYGWPAPRAVENNMPNSDGIDDLTQFWGDRAVTWTGFIVPNRESPYPALVWDKIRALAAPARRPWIYFEENGWDGERRMQLRGDVLTSPLARDFGPVITASAAWKAPAGVSESADQASSPIAAGVGTGGLCVTNTGYCFTTDPCAFTIPQGYVGTTTEIENEGNVVVYPTIIIVGQVVNPAIINMTTKQGIYLNGTVNPGQVLWIKCHDRTIYENNDPTLNKLSLYDYTKSSWLTLAPGMNQINYTFSGSAAGTCTMQYRHRWI